MEPSKIAEHLADKDDRYILNYILIAVLIAGVLGGVWLFRWLVGRLEEQTILLKGLFQQANDSSERNAGIIAEHTAATRELKDHLKDNTEFLRACKDHLARSH